MSRAATQILTRLRGFLVTKTNTLLRMLLRSCQELYLDVCHATLKNIVLTNMVEHRRILEGLVFLVSFESSWPAKNLHLHGELSLILE